MRTCNNWKLYVNNQEIKGKLEPKVLDLKPDPAIKDLFKQSIHHLHLNGVWVDADTKKNEPK